MRIVKLRRGGVEFNQVEKIFARVCARNYYGLLFNALIRGPIPGPSPDPGPSGEWGDKPRRSLGSIRMLNQPRICEMVSSGFFAMSQLKFVSTTRASFPIMPYTERENRGNSFCCLCQLLPYLSVFSFSHQARSFATRSFL